MLQKLPEAVHDSQRQHYLKMPYGLWSEGPDDLDFSPSRVSDQSHLAEISYFLEPNSLLSFWFCFGVLCGGGWGSEEQGEKGREHLKQCPHPARSPTPGFIPPP